MELAQVGIVGLSVMGGNLALNAMSKGYRTAVYERDAEIRRAFFRKNGAEAGVLAARRLEELPHLIRRPRIICLLVQAGRAVDDVLDVLIPELAPGDVLIDGGNSHWKDTNRRAAMAEKAGV